MREWELVRRRGLFLAEGTEVVRTLIERSRYAVRSVFLGENRLPALAEALASLPPEVPVYLGGAQLLSAVAGFDLHRGVLAAGERGVEREAAQELAALDARGGPATVLVLEALANHDNVGGLFRNAAALGADLVLLDPKSADPLYRKAIRVSMGAALTVPFARFTAWPEGLEQLRAMGFECVALTPDPSARELGSWLSGQEVPAQRVALLLGAEGAGLSPPVLARTAPRRIAMVPGVDSLNVATAGAIALYLLRAARQAGLRG